jgi:hypothetical protein
MDNSDGDFNVFGNQDISEIFRSQNCVIIRNFSFSSLHYNYKYKPVHINPTNKQNKKEQKQNLFWCYQENHISICVGCVGFYRIYITDLSNFNLPVTSYFVRSSVILLLPLIIIL